MERENQNYEIKYSLEKDEVVAQCANCEHVLGRLSTPRIRRDAQGNLYCSFGEKNCPTLESFQVVESYQKMSKLDRLALGEDANTNLPKDHTGDRPNENMGVKTSRKKRPEEGRDYGPPQEPRLEIKVYAPANEKGDPKEPRKK